MCLAILKSGHLFFHPVDHRSADHSVLELPGLKDFVAVCLLLQEELYYTPGVKKMSFDTLIMKAVTDELQAELTGAAVQRVYEPARGEIIIHLYSGGSQAGLLFSVDSRYARVHLTETRYRSKEKPSPFCMLLRKYLIGGRAVSFTNPPLERVLEIAFEPPDGMPPVKLVAEIMSRRSNLILIDGQGVILGAAKPVSWDKNPKRAIVPGEVYRQVPPQNKLDPLEMEQQEFVNSLRALIYSGKKPEQALFGAVKGISPLLARELLHRSGWADQDLDSAAMRLYAAVTELFNDYKNSKLQPVLLPVRKIYAALPLEHLPPTEQIKYERVNKMLERFYGALIREEREKQLKQQLESTVEKRLSRLYKKQKQQEKELAAAKNAPQHRLYGEMLLTYQGQVPRGADSAVLPDLYNPDNRVTVPLDPSKSVSANAQHHFSRYQKAKKGQQKIIKQLNKTRAEIKYCQGLLYAIENNDQASLEEIRQEMVETGYLREKAKRGPKIDSAPQPLKFTTSADHTILVGRNNRQNDYITFKTATRRDTWFHARELPGGHTVLKEAPYPPPAEDIEEAAFLAAYFSKGRENSAVAVDYTEIRHVRRRPGGKPGLVFYENFHTTTANPQDEKLRRRFKLQ